MNPERMAQPARAAFHAAYSGSVHHRTDQPPARRAAKIPKTNIRAPIRPGLQWADAMHRIEPVDKVRRPRHRPKMTSPEPAAFLQVSAHHPGFPPPQVPRPQPPHTRPNGL